MAEFSYLPLVEFIRDALWRHKPGRATGRASIMIGAGFSRNANPTSVSARPFPTWPALTEKLSLRLSSGSDPALQAAILRDAAGTSGALRLAQEYEAVFGRFQLDDFVRSTVPDEDHHPGDIHTRLLSLPWADIFTTNWDTLLERAQINVFHRAYDVVKTLSQIPSAAVPRIVKLHGTLPAHQPFIFTAEDYRSYPSRFAPFVNLVQQSMMENTFVLLGFSGDDPNFLHWSGWVRDNLGEQAPKVYLVGWLQIPPHRRRMLEDLNVVPVDLAELPQGRHWPEAQKHRYAVEWFLETLRRGQVPRASTWPSTPDSMPKTLAHLEPVPNPIRVLPTKEPQPRTSFQDTAEDRAEEVYEAAKIWKVNR